MNRFVCRSPFHFNIKQAITNCVAKPVIANDVTQEHEAAQRLFYASRLSADSDNHLAAIIRAVLSNNYNNVTLVIKRLVLSEKFAQHKLKQWIIEHKRITGLDTLPQDILCFITTFMDFYSSGTMLISSTNLNWTKQVSNQWLYKQVATIKKGIQNDLIQLAQIYGKRELIYRLILHPSILSLANIQTICNPRTSASKPALLNASNVPNAATISKWEKIMNPDIIFKIEKYMSINDILMFVKTNKYFYHQFSKYLLIINCNKWDILNLTHKKSLKWKFNGSDWSRFKYARIVFYMVQHKKHVQKRVPLIESANRMVYSGYYFHLKITQKQLKDLKIVIYQCDYSQQDQVYQFDQKWEKLYSLKKPLDICIIYDNIIVTYPDKVLCNVLMFESSMVQADALKKAVKYSNAKHIIFQDCQLTLPIFNIPETFDNEGQSERAVYIIDNYEWQQLIALFLMDGVIYQCNFKLVYYYGEWNEISLINNDTMEFWLDKLIENYWQTDNVKIILFFAVNPKKLLKTNLKWNIFTWIKRNLQLIKENESVSELKLGIKNNDSSYTFDIKKINDEISLQINQDCWYGVVNGGFKSYQTEFDEIWFQMQKNVKMNEKKFADM